MTPRSPVPRLTDIIEASELVRDEIEGVALDDFEADRRKRWIVERGIEIISEASRRLPDELKARHPEIPWPKVAGIGNVLCHNYGDVSAPFMWKLARDDLPLLEKICREELAAETEQESGGDPPPVTPCSVRPHQGSSRHAADCRRGARTDTKAAWGARRVTSSSTDNTAASRPATA